jgi:hypothetical protein
MKMLKNTFKTILGLSVALILIIVCGYILFIRSFRRMEFNGLGEQLSSALMKPITKNLDGSPVTAVEPESAELYSRAGEIGIVVARRKGPPPMTSQDLSEVEPEKRVDPWGRSFCFDDLGNRIAVISKGPNGSITECPELRKELSTARSVESGVLYRLSKGAFMVVVPKVPKDAL